MKKKKKLKYICIQFILDLPLISEDLFFGTPYVSFTSVAAAHVHNNTRRTHQKLIITCSVGNVAQPHINFRFTRSKVM